MSKIRHHPAAPTRVQLREAGDVIDRHRHDNHQLVYVSTGVLAVQTAAGAWVASCDRGVWVPAGLWHEHRFYGASAFHSVAFTLERAPLPVDAPAIVGVSAFLRQLLVACTDPALSPSEVRRVRAVLRDQLRRAQAQPVTLPNADDPRLADACAVVVDELSRPQPLSAVATRVGSSDRTLARLFREEFGMTYPQWRTNVRLYHAMIRLASGDTVTEVGQHCGWSTTSAFIDVFRRSMGQTPGSYRGAVLHSGGDVDG